jgi:Uma2 family endonuclease
MALVTWEEFVELHDDDRRELIDGVLVEVEVPNQRHDRIVARLCQLLCNWADEHDPNATVLASGYKVRISKYRGVMPDVQFFRSTNIAIDDPKAEIALHEGRPDLAVEIISPSSVRYDRVKKADWYLSIGVPEYWIIAPRNGILERMVLHREQWVRTDALDETGILRPTTFPGLEIPVGRLLDRPKRVR